MDNGFSSCRRDAFPAGLRVLVVDDDLTWLRILEKMLKKCSYEVTTCGLAREALNLLRERKDGYDIVISDVNMPDMDGFKLLEHVGLEMDLPVIMMSVDGETSRVMKGVQHGACDYLLKPIRMKELRNIWQHVLRKRIHEGREFDSHEGFEGIQLMRNAFDPSDDWNLFALEDMTSTKKRKDPDHNKPDNKDFGDPSSTKKARVVWSVDLHQKFVKAVNQIGFDKVGPKKILDLMNVPWLTRENVASHLQKYRLYLSRLQKENNQESSSSGMKFSDLPSKDPAGNFGFQNSIRRQQNDVAIDKHKNTDDKLLQQNADTDSHELHHRRTVSEPATEKRRALTSIIPDSKMRTTLQMGINQSFAPLESEADHATHDCTIPTQYSWNKVEEMQLKKESKSLLQFEDSFSQLPLCGTKHRIQVNESQSFDSVSTKPSTRGKEIAGCIETKALYADFSPVSSIGSVVDAFSFESKSHMVNDESLEPIATTKTQCFSLSCMPDLELYQTNLLLGGEAASIPSDKELQFCWLPGDFYNINFGLYNNGMPEYYDPRLLVEVPPLLCDPTENSVIDQGLFIA